MIGAMHRRKIVKILAEALSRLWTRPQFAIPVGTEVRNVPTKPVATDCIAFNTMVMSVVAFPKSMDHPRIVALGITNFVAPMFGAMPKEIIAKHPVVDFGFPKLPVKIPVKCDGTEELVTVRKPVTMPVAMDWNVSNLMDTMVVVFRRRMDHCLIVARGITKIVAAMTGAMKAVITVKDLVKARGFIPVKKSILVKPVGRVARKDRIVAMDWRVWNSKTGGPDVEWPVLMAWILLVAPGISKLVPPIVGVLNLKSIVKCATVRRG